MDYSIFINQKIINKNSEEGVVTFFNENSVSVKYQTCEKSYNPNVAFKNRFLKFVDDSLNELIDKALLEREACEKQEAVEIEKNNQDAIKRVKLINKQFKALARKNAIMKSLFGSDFDYPPFIEFQQKYRLLINKKKDLFDKPIYRYY